MRYVRYKATTKKKWKHTLHDRLRKQPTAHFRWVSLEQTRLFFGRDGLLTWTKFYPGEECGSIIAWHVLKWSHIAVYSCLFKLTLIEMELLALNLFARGRGQWFCTYLYSLCCSHKFFTPLIGALFWLFEIDFHDPSISNDRCLER